MHDPGLRNPRRNFLICVGVTLVAWAFVAWGAYEMRAEEKETIGSALKVGLALLPAILGPAAIYNFWRGMKVFAAIRGGENEIGRWTVTAAELAEFAVIDNARNAHGGEYLNVWTPPREMPPSGLEIIFVADGVLVGDTYFGLVTTGMFKFTRVGMLSEGPPTIEFVTVTTWANRFSVRTSVGVLRLPVSRLAGADGARVLDYYRRVLAREIIVNEGFYRGRMRFGLIAAPICFAVAAAGFVMKSIGAGDDSGDLSGLLIGIGIVFGTAMLILALAAWLLSQAQRRKR